MHKLSIAGSIIVDAVKLIDGWPEKSMLASITEKYLSVGGCVCNTGIDLKRLDPSIHVSVYGRVGYDEYGEFAVEKMKLEQLDISGIIRCEKPTSFTDVMTVCSTGERTFFNMSGADGGFLASDVDISKLDCEIFHLGYLSLLGEMDAPDAEYGSVSARFLHDLQMCGIKTSIDVVTSKKTDFQKTVIPALKYCNYLIVNEVEAGMIAGIEATDESGKVSVSKLEAICRAVLSLGVRECVVVHCPELSCSLTSAGKFTVVPSLDIPTTYIRGAVGAGDAFCAGMLYAFLNGMGEEEGMRLASCMAACNLAAADSVSGATSLENTMEKEKKFIRKRLELC